MGAASTDSVYYIITCKLCSPEPYIYLLICAKQLQCKKGLLTQDLSDSNNGVNARKPS